MAARTAAAPGPAETTAFKPWQFFVLAGMFGATATVIVATGQSPAGIVTLSLTVLAGSLVAIGAYETLVPLVSPDATHAPKLIQGRTRAALEREKTLALRAIKELEFDHAMGKIADADFQDVRDRLRARAIGLIQQLDAGGGYRTVIDRELEVRLGRKPARPADAGTGGGTAAIDTDPAPAAAGVCASCGVGNDADARFCKNCGSKLA
ncbi:MAG: zinc ribbon domain-containing protein [Acidobacteriota bacterium]